MTYPWREEHRLLALYDLNLDLPPETVRAAFVGCVDTLPFTPNRMAFAVESRPNPRQKRLGKGKSVNMFLAAETLPIRWINVERIYEDNYSQLSGQMSFDLKRGRIDMSAQSAEFDLPSAVSFVTRCLRIGTPTYGFAHRMTGGLAASFWPSGVTTMDLGTMETSQAEKLATARATLLGSSLSWSKEHLSKLHDVYEVNILTEKHLERPIMGKSFSGWIDEGGRGSLSKLSDGIFAWTVPDAVRPIVRHHLLNAGCLFVHE